ncbi:unnamed protein product [Polarella glacialis]|uniref:RanBP2-type domain-containing protein n=1 Tax=Polarella glacialis TaxID=89957 RepID=A0A813EIG3_POLGL|nr:unnamed protein product [Polarella glacialis]
MAEATLRTLQRSFAPEQLEADDKPDNNKNSNNNINNNNNNNSNKADDKQDLWPPMDDWHSQEASTGAPSAGSSEVTAGNSPAEASQAARAARAPGRWQCSTETSSNQRWFSNCEDPSDYFWDGDSSWEKFCNPADGRIYLYREADEMYFFEDDAVQEGQRSQRSQQQSQDPPEQPSTSPSSPTPRRSLLTCLETCSDDRQLGRPRAASQSAARPTPAVTQQQQQRQPQPNPLGCLPPPSGPGAKVLSQLAMRLSDFSNNSGQDATKVAQLPPLELLSWCAQQVSQLGKEESLVTLCRRLHSRTGGDLAALWLSFGKQSGLMNRRPEMMQPVVLIYFICVAASQSPQAFTYLRGKLHDFERIIVDLVKSRISERTDEKSEPADDWSKWEAISASPGASSRSHEHGGYWQEVAKWDWTPEDKWTNNQDSDSAAPEQSWSSRGPVLNSLGGFMESQADTDKEVSKFIADNRLDDHAARALQKAPSTVQQTVICGEWLRAVRNPSAALVGRLRDESARLAAGSDARPRNDASQHAINDSRATGDFRLKGWTCGKCNSEVFAGWSRCTRCESFPSSPKRSSPATQSKAFRWTCPSCRSYFTGTQLFAGLGGCPCCTPCPKEAGWDQLVAVVKARQAVNSAEAARWHHLCDSQPLGKNYRDPFRQSRAFLRWYLDGNSNNDNYDNNNNDNNNNHEPCAGGGASASSRVDSCSQSGWTNNNSNNSNTTNNNNSNNDRSTSAEGEEVALVSAIHSHGDTRSNQEEWDSTNNKLFEKPWHQRGRDDKTRRWENTCNDQGAGDKWRDNAGACEEDWGEQRLKGDDLRETGISGENVTQARMERAQKTTTDQQQNRVREAGESQSWDEAMQDSDRVFSDSGKATSAATPSQRRLFQQLAQDAEIAAQIASAASKLAYDAQRQAARKLAELSHFVRQLAE